MSANPELIATIAQITLGVITGVLMVLPILATAHRKVEEANKRCKTMPDHRNTQDAQFKQLADEKRVLVDRINRALDRSKTKSPNSTVLGMVDILAPGLRGKD